jgi:hypothetical protein
MNDYASQPRDVPLDWLLSEGTPWVRYRTLVDLEDRPEEDSEMITAQQAMIEHARVQDLIAELKTWPGYTLKRHNDAKHLIHKLAVLADFGLQASDPRMAPVMERIMAHQAPEGAFQIVTIVPRAFGGTDTEAWTWMLCDAPTILYALLAMGLSGDPGVQVAVEHLSSLVRDNGWPCASSPHLGKFRGPGRKDDPCPYANLVALKALAQMPGMLESEACRTGVETLLWHWEHQKERKLYMFGIGTDFRKPKYPFVWYDILHVIDVLTRFPFARQDPRLQAMVSELAAQADDRGRFTAGSMYRAWQEWEFASKKAPSPWITFLAWRAIKRCG